MKSTFFRYKHYPVYIRDRNVYEKLKCLCGVASKGNVDEDVFNTWLEQTINKEYDRKASPLGV